MSNEVNELNRHNFVRTMSSADQYIVEIGMGNQSPDQTKSDGFSEVTPSIEKGIAIGHDNLVDENYGIVLGNHQKLLTPHGIGEGSYLNLIERYGEKRRTFGDNTPSRSWFEWYKSVEAVTEPPGPLWVSLTLHNTGNKLVLKDWSALTFNIKVVGGYPYGTGLALDVNGYHISGTIKRLNSAGTTAIVGSIIVDSFEDISTLDARVVADTGNGALDLQVLTHPTYEIHWAAAGWVVEHRFPAP